MGSIAGILVSVIEIISGFPDDGSLEEAEVKIKAGLTTIVKPSHIKGILNNWKRRIRKWYWIDEFSISKNEFLIDIEKWIFDP